MVEQRAFGKLGDGAPVQQFTLRNKAGMEVRLLDYGARLTHILLPVAGGGVDVLLGFDEVQAYERDPSLQGAFVGRYANRIAGAAFTIGETEYHLTKNVGENFLHGSCSRRMFEAEVIGESSVSLTYTSPDGEDGFPGELWMGIIYTLSDNNELMLDYRARTTAETHLNLTNHAYFNLGGQEGGSIEGHELWMNCEHFLEIGEDLCPTGRMPAVEGGAFDFTSPKLIGRDIKAKDPQLEIAKGYDHCMIISRQKPGGLAHAATLRHPPTGREMRLYTTQPAFQLYTGNSLDGIGKKGRPFEKWGAVCLETQHYPDSPNQPDFPSTLLGTRDKFHQITVMQFDWHR